jgi:hypothetical protein
VTTSIEWYNGCGRDGGSGGAREGGRESYSLVFWTHYSVGAGVVMVIEIVVVATFDRCCCCCGSHFLLESTNCFRNVFLLLMLGISGAR